MLKLDLEKAYDQVNWDFLLETLEFFGFLSTILKLIRTCIYTTTLEVLWNGTRTEAFTLARGLRQGDPLSPYLFMLYLERLSMLIHQAVERKLWHTVDVCQGGSKIPQLFFADDLLLFSKAHAR